MIWLKFLSKLIRILNKGATPKQIAGGIALGSIIGLTPSFMLNLFVFFLILIINVNISAAIFSMVVFKLVSYLIDPLANSVGYELLVETDWLKSLWTTLYNAPIVPFTKFNNTVVLGSLVISLVLFFPLLFLTARGVVLYRERLMSKIADFKIVKLLKASKIYGLYKKVRNLAP